jgi:hypothetical protein
MLIHSKPSRMMARLAWVGALSIVIACEAAQAPDLASNQWQALGISSYSFVYTKSCECTVTGPNPSRITVVNGAVTKVTSADDAATVFNGNIAAFPTVDTLFAIAARVRKQNAAKINITYDNTYHFPREIYIDPEQNAIDDEITWRVDAFTPSLK